MPLQTRYQEAREQAGYSVRQAAKVLATTPNRLRQIEHAKVWDRGHEAMAKLYHVTPCWLAGHTTMLSDDLVGKLNDLASKSDVLDRDAQMNRARGQLVGDV